MDYLDIDAPYSFIGGGKIDHDICDGLIEFYQDCTYLDKEPGHHGGGIDKSVKDSMDLTVPRYLKDERVTRYIDQLAEVTKLYCDFYPQLKTINWDLVEDFNIQWYPKNGGFKKLHCERGSNHPQCSSRIMAWMTYLNDVEEGGETYFETQKAKIKPAKGLTLVWPADWTHMHYGIPAPNEEKIIVTGWYDLI
tara:strand:- start:10840 stop:11418 length:579 start_codon:yes stop_codon:yes gene_type:complete